MIVYTTATAQNIRAGVGTEYRIVGTAKSGQRITVGDAYACLIGKVDAWVPVTFGTVRGFMLASLLVKDAPFPIPPPIPTPPGWSYGNQLVGAHGPADPSDWAWDDRAFDAIRVSRVEAVKILSAADIGARVVVRLNAMGVRFLCARMINVIYPDSPKSGVQYVQEIQDAALRLYAAGVRYFEVYNEPNLSYHPDRVPQGAPEGFGVMGYDPQTQREIGWNDGGKFARQWWESVEYMRRLMPEAQFGFPAMSPGHSDYFRYDGERMLSEALATGLVSRASFIAHHVYWNGIDLSLDSAIAAVRAFALRFPNTRILVTEFSNVNPGISKNHKGDEYVEFYRKAKQLLPANVGALFSFCLKSSSGFEAETWVDSDGRLSPIPVKVGNR